MSERQNQLKYDRLTHPSIFVFTSFQMSQMFDFVKMPQHYPYGEILWQDFGTVKKKGSSIYQHFMEITMLLTRTSQPSGQLTTLANGC